jgi:hypothetical protein
MSSVWLAERTDGRFDRRVAIKFLSAVYIGRGDERFRREGGCSRGYRIRILRN